MRAFLLVVLGFVLWMGFTGDTSVENIVAGILVAGLSTFLFGRDFPYRRKKVFQIRRYGCFLAFLGLFAVKLVKANLIMAYRVLHPRLPIKPGIVRVPLEMTSPLGRLILANSITLTPGTLTVEITRTDLYIHWIYLYEEKDRRVIAEDIAGAFQRILRRVFE